MRMRKCTRMSCPYAHVHTRTGTSARPCAHVRTSARPHAHVRTSARPHVRTHTCSSARPLVRTSARAHTCARPHVNAHAHTHVHTRTRTRTSAHLHVRMHTRTRAHMSARARARARARTRAHTRPHFRTSAHPHAHAHVHTHVHPLTTTTATACTCAHTGVKPALGHDKKCSTAEIVGALKLSSSAAPFHITHGFNVQTFHHRDMGTHESCPSPRIPSPHMRDCVSTRSCAHASACVCAPAATWACMMSSPHGTHHRRRASLRLNPPRTARTPFPLWPALSQPKSTSPPRITSG